MYTKFVLIAQAIFLLERRDMHTDTVTGAEMTLITLSIHQLPPALVMKLSMASTNLDIRV